jgi:hypothetical protein
MGKLNKLPWEVGTILVCSKCGAKFNQPNLAEEVKVEIRKTQKAEETLSKIRVVPTMCLGVCYPEKQTIAFAPVDGKTEIITVDLKKEVVLSEVGKLIHEKLKS